MLKSIRTIRISNDLIILLLLALARLALHSLTNHQYGFHRDELAVLDDARRLAWGYVAYPPLTPFIGRIALELFGPSLVGLRFFAALAQSIGMVLAGLIARELGGGRWAVVVAALATAIAPMSLIMGALFQYIAFDYLWWVLAAYLLIRLLKSDDPRWWLPIGLTLGLGMLTKYTIAFYIVGIAAGELLTPASLQRKSPRLRPVAALKYIVILTNLHWHIQNDFISIEIKSSIHASKIDIVTT
jgi:4-amino-4-deoxy-L-arabinose transferase-like glycosyltransferase